MATAVGKFNAVPALPLTSAPADVYLDCDANALLLVDRRMTPVTRNEHEVACRLHARIGERKRGKIGCARGHDGRRIRVRIHSLRGACDACILAFVFRAR